MELKVLCFDTCQTKNIGASTHEKVFSVITSLVNISWREQVFWPTKGTRGLQHHKFLIFDGKQHP